MMPSELYDIFGARSLHDLFLVLAEYPWESVNWAHVALEGFLVAFVLLVLFQKRYNIKDKKRESEKLTEKEIDELCAEWEPAPLLPAEQPEQERLALESLRVVHSAPGRTIKVEPWRGGEVVERINLGSTDFLGLQADAEMVALSERTVRRYGCGTCGPRGFYGTLDVHLELEGSLAEWLGVEDSCLYSSNLASLSSAIPAFLKVQDTIFVDEGVSLLTRVGVTLSRSRVVVFRHNDMDHLEAELARIEKDDRRRAAKLYKKFVVVEGLYVNYGDLCPLPRLLELKQRYKFRTVVDDSMALGVLGEKGRGTAEHFGIEPARIDMLAASLGAALPGIGGITAGAQQFATHQRLAASGYVFSCSTPAYLAATPLEAVRRLAKGEGDMPARIRALAAEFWCLLLAADLPGVVLAGEKGLSPIIHMRLADPPADRDEADLLLQRIVDAADNRTLLLVRSKYSPREPNPPPPSIRLAITLNHPSDSLPDLVNLISLSLKDVFHS